VHEAAGSLAAPSASTTVAQRPRWLAQGDRGRDGGRDEDVRAPHGREARDALPEDVQWTAGHVAWLREEIQKLDPAAPTWGLAEETEVGSGEYPGVDRTSKAVPLS